MKRVFVSGGLGFMGSDFIRYLFEIDPKIEVLNFDKMTYAGNPANVASVAGNPRYRFVKGDIANPKDVRAAFKRFKPEIAVNFAAESITENTYISIRSVVGTRMMTFGELWNQQAENNKPKKTNKGEIILLRGRQTRVLSFLNGGQWLPIKAITRHWYKGTIVQLRQKWGTIEATPNHSIYSANLALVNPTDNPELLVVRTVNENNRKYRRVKQDLLKILAAYITEGNATFNRANGGYIVEISQANYDWLSALGKAIKRVFGKRYSITKGKGSYHLQVSNKQFFNYLVKECGKYAHNKYFPDWIFDISPSDREYFWKKLLEGDGTKDGRYTTTSYKLANQLSLLLALIGKKFVVYERTFKNKKWNKNWNFRTGRHSHHGLVEKKNTKIRYEGWVYDLEVEQTHNFVCGIGNVVCHNTHVDRSILDPSAFIKTDVQGTQVLLEAMREFGTARYIQISTDEVYGSIERGTFTEDSPPRPNSPYAASKAGGDLMVRAYVKTYQVPAITTRSCNNFGPHQYPEKVIPLFITNLLEGKKVPLYGTGNNVREWIYVRDHSRAVWLLATKGTVGEVYNIGTGYERSNAALTRQLLALTGKTKAMVERVADRPGHDLRYALDTKKIATLGFKPSINFREGLSRTVDWYKDNEGWWKKIKTGQYRAYYRKNYAKRQQP